MSHHARTSAAKSASHQAVDIANQRKTLVIEQDPQIMESAVESGLQKHMKANNSERESLLAYSKYQSANLNTSFLPGGIYFLKQCFECARVDQANAQSVSKR